MFVDCVNLITKDVGFIIPNSPTSIEIHLVEPRLLNDVRLAFFFFRNYIRFKVHLRYKESDAIEFSLLQQQSQLDVVV